MPPTFGTRATLTAALLAATMTRAMAAPIEPAGLAGTWAGSMSHAGETQPIALDLAPDTAGAISLRLSIPAVHLDHLPLGRVPLRAEGDSIRIGPFRLLHDPAAGTLSGLMPAGLVPAYEVPVRLQRVDRYDVPARPELAAPEARALWEFPAGSPLWAGATYARGVVYAGAQDGRLFALDARTGALLWEARTGGPIRSRPSVSGRALYVQADDGFLYKLDVSTGREIWRVKTAGHPAERLPFSDPRSRYDRFGCDVVVAGDRLFVGTHEGALLALDARDGRRRWSFATGDAILAAPLLDRGTLYVGSFDRAVYAVDARTGALRWKRATGGAVVSTPAVYGDQVIVGNRAYDLLGLDRRTGAVAWTRYVWMSWVESSVTVRDGVGYVGSSDAAVVQAFDPGTGRRRWTTDVLGWAWGQPAVGARRLYVGTSGQVGYPVRSTAAVVALDRTTGRPVWRYSIAVPDSGAYGVPGSPALGEGRVFVAGLDGRVRAFAE